MRRSRTDILIERERIRRNGLSSKPLSASENLELYGSNLRRGYEKLYSARTPQEKLEAKRILAAADASYWNEYSKLKPKNPYIKKYADNAYVKSARLHDKRRR